MKCILAAGGTGGHVFPALALYNQLCLQNHDVYFFTESRGLPFLNNKIPSEKTVFLNLSKPSSYRYYLSLLTATLRCLYWLKKAKPQAVMGFGGYPSIPIVLAAQLLKIPTVIHEQNTLLGKANRLLAKKSAKIFFSFPPPKGTVPYSKEIYTGNPVRSELIPLYNQDYKPPIDSDPFTLLILGGSQGAAILGPLIPKALSALPWALKTRLNVYHQCRSEYGQEVKDLYEKGGINHVVLPFFDNMADLYSKAHLVICRSGASTIAELAIAKRPALFIPFAGAKESDQLLNAKRLLETGACWILEEANLTIENLSSQLKKLIGNPNLLSKTSRKIQAFAKPDATLEMAKIIAEMAFNLLPFS